MMQIPLDRIEQLKKVVLSNPTIKHKNSGAISIGVPPGADGMPEWKRLLGKELYDYLETIVYPYDKPIMLIRGNLYTKGTYFNLHIDNVLQTKDDFINCLSKEEKHVTSITLDKSDDLEGGLIVKGDIWDTLDAFDMKLNINRTPLEIYDPKIGECISWDWNTIHGVTKIVNGSRLSLVVIKHG